MNLAYSQEMTEGGGVKSKQCIHHPATGKQDLISLPGGVGLESAAGLLGFLASLACRVWFLIPYSGNILFLQVCLQRKC